MTSKKCNRCKKELPIESFGLSYDNRQGRKVVVSYCKKCKLKMKDERLKSIREWMFNFKSNQSCAKCGYSRETHKSFTPKALQFHHAQDNKEIIISQYSSRGFSIDTLKKEIAKCVVLCARCHAEIHS